MLGAVVAMIGRVGQPRRGSRVALRACAAFGALRLFVFKRLYQALVLRLVDLAVLTQPARTPDDQVIGPMMRRVKVTSPR